MKSTGSRNCSSGLGYPVLGTFLLAIGSFFMVPADAQNVESFAAGDSPRGLAFDGANIWVANDTNIGNHGHVTKLRAGDGLILDTIQVGPYPYGVAYDGESVWV